MILQALYNYNSRNPEKSPDGWITHLLDYLILIDSQGRYQGLRNLREKREGSKKELGKLFLVPNIGKQVFKHTNAGNDPNLLWDNTTFALGAGKDGNQKLEYFRAELHRWLPEAVLRGPLVPLDAFLQTLIQDKGLRDQILNDPKSGTEMRDGLANVSFALDGDPDTWLERPSVRAEFDYNFPKLGDAEASIGACLITGKTKVALEPTHSVIKGMKGDKDPNFVSFNKASFCSYGKEQGMNAPCGKEAVRGYVAALNDLLREGSRQVVRFGKLTTVFWTETPDPFENAFATLLGFLPSQNPNQGTGELKQALEGLFSGHFSSGGNRSFFALSLEAMGPRLAIRSWKSGTIREVSASLVAWFGDLQLNGLDPYKGMLGLRQLLQSTSPHTRAKPFGDSDRIIPSLEPRLMECALDMDALLPRSILLSCISRIRAEASIDSKNKDYVLSQRTALLKAYLIRLGRSHSTNHKEITVSLDPANTDPGYVLGRLFALLERIQLASNNYKEVNSGIRDRFYGAFSSTPVTTLPMLMKLKNHHLSKIENKGESVNLERALGAVVDLLSPKVPPHLSMEDQAGFAVGYYHQRQAFFTKGDKTATSTQV